MQQRQGEELVEFHVVGADQAVLQTLGFELLPSLNKCIICICVPFHRRQLFVIRQHPYPSEFELRGTLSGFQ